MQNETSKRNKEEWATCATGRKAGQRGIMNAPAVGGGGGGEGQCSKEEGTRWIQSHWLVSGMRPGSDPEVYQAGDPWWARRELFQCKLWRKKALVGKGLRKTGNEVKGSRKVNHSWRERGIKKRVLRWKKLPLICTLMRTEQNMPP